MKVERIEHSTHFISAISAKLSDYGQLTKIRLSASVVFSSGLGFLLGTSGEINWWGFFMICLGGILTTGASNAINQVIEKDFDKMMERTKNRPLPAERMTPIEAILFAGASAVIGIGILWIYFNQLAALFSAVALISYAFIYTPMKRFSPAAVYIGAVPGALPPLIGYVAATNTLTVFSGALFLLQFIWQLPHFWAIAWVAYDDYIRAGYKLLPSREGRNRFSAMQNIIYIIILFPVSLIPMWLGMSGPVSAVILILADAVFLYQAIKLYRTCSMSAAKQFMFGSFIYLPIVLLALFLDKI